MIMKSVVCLPSPAFITHSLYSLQDFHRFAPKSLKVSSMGRGHVIKNRIGGGLL